VCRWRELRSEGCGIQIVQFAVTLLHADGVKTEWVRGFAWRAVAVVLLCGLVASTGAPSFKAEAKEVANTTGSESKGSEPSLATLRT
jgi:hypothetical protein